MTNRKSITEKQKRKNLTGSAALTSFGTTSRKKRKQRREDLKEGRAIPWQLTWNTRRVRISRQRVTELEAKVKEIEENRAGQFSRAREKYQRRSRGGVRRKLLKVVKF